MKSGYSYLKGVEELLCSLRQNNYEIHAFTNYPIWLEDIISDSFLRKPDLDFYLDALKHLEVYPANSSLADGFFFITKNVEAAIAVGIVGLHFKNAEKLGQDISIMGIDVST
ncbi:hypothetical protein UlMin_030193 [Ulmus minor]